MLTSTRRQEEESGSADTVEAFVSALGADTAAKLFLAYGGSVLYVSERPRPGSRLIKTVGWDGAAALWRHFGGGNMNIPLANAWLARQLDAQGVSRAEITRRLRISRDSLQRYLSGAAGEAA